MLNQPQMVDVLYHPLAIQPIRYLYDSDDNKLNIKPGQYAPRSTLVVVACDRGYSVVGRNDSNCRAGVWKPSLPACVKICPSLKPEGVELSCRYDGREISCNRNLLPGTEVHVRCMALHHTTYEPNYSSVHCQDNGEWDQTLYKCTPDCGLSSSRGLISQGAPAIFGDSPWHVAIYRIPDKYLLICGGTLIHQQIVLSAAHCFYDEAENQPLNQTKDYEIVVSKITRAYSKNDAKTQDKRHIKEMYYHDKGYNPRLASHYGSDIMLIILDKPVIISQYVLPACLATSENGLGFNPGENVIGKLVGWGADEHGNLRETLYAADLPYMSYNECIKKESHVTNDKFCAGSASGPGANLGDSGGGLLFRKPSNGLFYLRGIVSTKGRYSNTSISTFTDVSLYMDWITNMFHRVEKTTTKIPLTPSAMKKTQCPPLVGSGVILTCEYKNKSVDCGSHMQPGTEVRPQCKAAYVPPHEPAFTVIHCQDNGEWDQQLYTCTPGCGYAHTYPNYEEENIPILNYYPWLVTIFKMGSPGKYSLVCSGTLIHQQVVVSAASCFYDVRRNRPLNRTTDYEIVVGKTTRWYTNTDTTAQDKRKVKELLYSETGYNPRSNTGSDILLIILDKPVKIDHFVRYACLGSTGGLLGFNPGEHISGDFLGWGADEYGNPGDILKASRLPYMSYHECNKRVPNTSLTTDQFCTEGTNDGPGPQIGDGGVGLVFMYPDDDLYYLRGIFGNKGRSVTYTNTTIHSYTDVSFYIEWISEVISRVNLEANN